MLCFILFIFSSIVTITAQFDSSTCGSQKKCFFIPPSCEQKGNCRQILSYFPNDDDWVTFELFDKPADKMVNIVAVGFSEDGLMGNEPVTHCSFDDNPAAHLSYNDGKVNIQLPNNKEEFEANNLELLNATRGNEYLYCRFRQRIHPVEANDYNFSLDKNATLFLVHSAAEDPKIINMHSLDPNSEDYPTFIPVVVNVARTYAELDNRVKKEEGGMSSITRRKLVLLHGCLMIPAFIGLLSIGIPPARYFKDLYKDDKLLGVPLWFQLHRAANFLSVMLVVTATIIIFIANDLRWTGPTLKKSFYENLTARSSMHSLFGLLSVIMVIMQPIGALFRCHPGEKYRSVFNFIHHNIGRVSFIFASFAIALAAWIFHVWASRLCALITLGAYCITSVIYVVSMEVLSMSKKEMLAEELELKNRQDGNGDSEANKKTTLEGNNFARKRYTLLNSSSGSGKSTPKERQLQQPFSLFSAIKHFVRVMDKKKSMTVLHAVYSLAVCIISAVLIVLMQRS